MTHKFKYTKYKTSPLDIVSVKQLFGTRWGQLRMLYFFVKSNGFMYIVNLQKSKFDHHDL